MSAKVTEVPKGAAPRDDLLFEIADEVRARSFRSHGFQDGAFPTVPAMLFAGRYRERALYRENTPEEEKAKRQGAFLRIGRGWYFLRGDAKDGKWKIASKLQVLDGGWDGSAEMLWRCVKYAMAAGERADWPLTADAEWDTDGRIKVGRVNGKVHDLVAVDLAGRGRRTFFVLSEEGDRAFQYDVARKAFGDVTASLGLASKSMTAVFADFNADGRADLASWNGRDLTIWSQSSKGTFQTKLTTTILEDCLGLGVVDAGSKGVAGIIVSTRKTPVLLTLREDGALKTREVAALPGEQKPPVGNEQEFKDLGPARACVLADFDGDAVADILQPYERGGLFYRGAGRGVFGMPRVCRNSAPEPREPLYEVRDHGEASSWKPVWRLRGSLHTGLGPAISRTGDFDGDGMLDAIFFLNHCGNNQWHNTGSGDFDAPYPMGQANWIHSSGQTGGSVGDVNNDGRQDFVALRRNSAPAVFFNQGFSAFCWSSRIQLEHGVTRVGEQKWEPTYRFEEVNAGQQAGLLADVNDDGRQDLALVLSDGNVWVVFQKAEKGKGLCVRAGLPVEGGFAGPLTVTGHADGRCLGAWNVVAGTDEAFFGRKTPGDVTLKWQFPEGKKQEATVTVKDGPVRVFFGPNGLTNQ